MSFLLGALLAVFVPAALSPGPARAVVQGSPASPPDPTLELPLPPGVVASVPGPERRQAALEARLAGARPGSGQALRASMGLGALKVMAGRHDEGQALLLPVARSGGPLSGWAWLYVGLARRNQGDPAQALAAFDQAGSGRAEISPAREAALLRLYCLEALGQDAQALQGYRALLARPGQAFRPVHLWRAALLADKAGDQALAQACLRELLLLHAWSASAQKALPLARDMFDSGRSDWSPDSAEVLAARARALLDRSLPGRALPLVEQLAATPGADPAQVLYLRGRTAYLRRHTREAAEAFAAVAEAHPASPLAPWALYQQARCLWRSGEEEDAAAMRELLRACLTRADQGSDLPPSALRLLMLANLERARFDQASETARRLAALGQAENENARQAAWLLGLIALAKGDFSGAKAEISAWMQGAHGADRSAALYWLARTAAASGDREKATALYRETFAAWPGGYYAAMAEDRLAAMGQGVPRPEAVPGCPGRPGDAPSDKPDAGPDAAPAVRPNAGSSAGPDARPDAGTSAGPNAGTNAGANTGSNAGPNAGPGAGTNAGPNAGANTGPGAGTNTGPGAGTNAEFNGAPVAVPATGPNSGPGSGANARINPESNNGARIRTGEATDASSAAAGGGADEAASFPAGDDQAADASNSPSGDAAEAPDATPPEVQAGLERARLLEDCQLPELAERDLAALLEGHPTVRPLALAWARLGQARGDALEAARAVSRAYAPCLARAAPEDLAPLRDILYPRRFADILARQVAGSQVDLNLVCALIRQESFFQPEAVSPAGAVGLMQIMPATGRDLASRLGYKDFRPERLRDPAVNIQLGVRLLLDRHARYGGNLAFALAAYNAGHVKLKVWAAHLGGLEPDLFTEFIPYGETRDYVKRILANRAMYRRLYPEGAAANP